MNLDKTQLLHEIQSIRNTGNYPYGLKTFIQTLEKEDSHHAGFYLNELETYLNTQPDTIEIAAIFPTWNDGNNIYWGGLVALTAYLLKHLLEGQKMSHQTIKGDYEVSETTVIEGNLTVTGNLSVTYVDEQAIGLIVLGDLVVQEDYAFEDGCLVVLGDLLIDGAFNESSDFSLTVVGGKVHAKKFLNSSGQFYAIEKVSSPMLYFSYNQGFCALNNGFKALFFRESDHMYSFSLGKNEALFIAIDEMSGVPAKRKLEHYKDFFGLFTEEALGDCSGIDLDEFDEEEYGEDVDEYLEEEHDFELDDFIYKLTEVFAEGQAVFKAEVLAQFEG